MAFIDTYFKEVEQRFAVMKQEREPLERAARLLFERRRNIIPFTPSAAGTRI